MTQVCRGRWKRGQGLRVRVPNWCTLLKRVSTPHSTPSNWLLIETYNQLPNRHHFTLRWNTHQPACFFVSQSYLAYNRVRSFEPPFRKHRHRPQTSRTPTPTNLRNSPHTQLLPARAQCYTVQHATTPTCAMAQHPRAQYHPPSPTPHINALGKRDARAARQP